MKANNYPVDGRKRPLNSANIGHIVKRWAFYIIMFVIAIAMIDWIVHEFLLFFGLIPGVIPPISPLQ